MSKELVKCPSCGGTDFIGSQHVSGSVPVNCNVTKDTEAGAGWVFDAMFVSNPTPNGELDTSGLDCSGVEGPFYCSECDIAIELK